MPDLDVTEALTDPDFVDPLALTCERNTQTVSAAGVASIAPVLTKFTGVVTNEDGDVLVREADGERVESTIFVVTSFRLTVGQGDGYTADVVQFSGRRFTVAQVQDYSTYGPGFVQARCELVPLGGR